MKVIFIEKVTIFYSTVNHSRTFKLDISQTVKRKIYFVIIHLNTVMDLLFLVYAVIIAQFSFFLYFYLLIILPLH